MIRRKIEKSAFETKILFGYGKEFSEENLKAMRQNRKISQNEKKIQERIDFLLKENDPRMNQSTWRQVAMEDLGMKDDECPMSYDRGYYMTCPHCEKNSRLAMFLGIKEDEEGDCDRLLYNRLTEVKGYDEKTRSLTMACPKCEKEIKIFSEETEEISFWNAYESDAERDLHEFFGTGYGSKSASTKQITEDTQTRVSASEQIYENDDSISFYKWTKSVKLNPSGKNAYFLNITRITFNTKTGQSYILPMLEKGMGSKGKIKKLNGMKNATLSSLNTGVYSVFDENASYANEN